MNPVTKEWLDNVEEDFEVASELLQLRNPRHFNSVCYHCQQAVEKFLKAVLHENNYDTPKIHNLSVLLDKAVEFLPLLEAQRETCIELTKYATVFRYPGYSATREDSNRALKQCKNVRADIKHYFEVDHS